MEEIIYMGLSVAWRNSFQHILAVIVPAGCLACSFFRVMKLSYTQIHCWAFLSIHLVHIIPLRSPTVYFYNYILIHKEYCVNVNKIHSHNGIGWVQLRPESDVNYTQIVSTRYVRCIKPFSLKRYLTQYSLFTQLPCGFTIFQMQYLS